MEAAPQAADPSPQSAGRRPERRASEGSAAAQSQPAAAEPPTAEERRALAVATEMASRLRDAIAAVLQACIHEILSTGETRSTSPVTGRHQAIFTSTTCD